MRDVTPRDTANVKVITGASPEAVKANTAPKAKPAPVETEASAPSLQHYPTREEMSAAIKARMKELKIGLPVTETRLREAGLLNNGQTMVKTTDAELYKISQNLDALNPPLGTAKEPEVIPAIYENHAVTRSPEGAERAWVCHKLRYSIAGEESVREAVSFSSTVGDLLDTFEGAEAILLTLKSTEKGDQIVTLELAPKEGGAA